MIFLILKITLKAFYSIEFSVLPKIRYKNQRGKIVKNDEKIPFPLARRPANSPIKKNQRTTSLFLIIHQNSRHCQYHNSTKLELDLERGFVYYFSMGVVPDEYSLFQSQDRRDSQRSAYSNSRRRGTKQKQADRVYPQGVCKKILAVRKGRDDRPAPNRKRDRKP